MHSHNNDTLVCVCVCVCVCTCAVEHRLELGIKSHKDIACLAGLSLGRAVNIPSHERIQFNSHLPPFYLGGGGGGGGRGLLFPFSSLSFCFHLLTPYFFSYML